MHMFSTPSSECFCASCRLYQLLVLPQWWSHSRSQDLCQPKSCASLSCNQIFVLTPLLKALGVRGAVNLAAACSALRSDLQCGRLPAIVNILGHREGTWQLILPGTHANVSIAHVPLHLLVALDEGALHIMTWSAGDLRFSGEDGWGSDRSKQTLPSDKISIWEILVRQVDGICATGVAPRSLQSGEWLSQFVGASSIEVEKMGALSWCGRHLAAPQQPLPWSLGFIFEPLLNGTHWRLGILLNQEHWLGFSATLRWPLQADGSSEPLHVAASVNIGAVLDIRSNWVA